MLWLLQFTWIGILILELAYKFLKETNRDFDNDNIKSEVIYGAQFIQKLERPFLLFRSSLMSLCSVLQFQCTSFAILLLNLLPNIFLPYATLSRIVFLVSFLGTYSQWREMQLIFVYLYHTLQTCRNCLLGLTGAWIP